VYEHERREIGEDCGRAVTHFEEELEDLDTFEGEPPERAFEMQGWKWYMHGLWLWVGCHVVNCGSPQADSEVFQPRAVGINHLECTRH